MKNLISISILMLTLLGLISTSEAYTQKRAYTFSTNCKMYVTHADQYPADVQFTPFGLGKANFVVHGCDTCETEAIIDCKLPNDYMYSGSPQSWQCHQGNYTSVTFQHTMVTSGSGINLYARICQNNYWGGETCATEQAFSGTGTTTITTFNNLAGANGAPFLRIRATWDIGTPAYPYPATDYIFSTYIVSRTL